MKIPRFGNNFLFRIVLRLLSGGHFLYSRSGAGLRRGICGLRIYSSFRTGIFRNTGFGFFGTILFRFRNSFFLAVYLHEFLAGYGFFFYQIFSDLVHDGTVAAEKLQRLFIAFLQDAHDFGINLRRCYIGAVHHGSAVQILAFHGLQADQAEFLAHTVLRYHGPCYGSGFLYIIGSPRSNGVKYNLLRGPACQQAYQHVMQLRLGVEEFFLLRHLHYISQRAHGPGNNGDFLHGLGVLLKGAHKRMPHLVVGYDAAFLLAHDTILFLFSYKHLFHCLEQVLLADIIPALFHRIDSGLIYHIGKIRAYSPAGCKRYGIEIHGIIHENVLGMHPQNFHTALQVWLIHNDLPVKTSGTQQRLIQDFRPVGSTQNQDTSGTVKAIHLRKQLVQCLFPLFIPAAVFGITAPADGINFIDEYNTRRILGSFLKQITYTGSTHTYIKLYKIRTGQRKERNMGFPRHCLGKQGFTGSGRAYEKRSLGKLGSNLGISSRVVQEIHYLHERFLGLVLSCHILKCYAGFLLYVNLGIALSHSHRASAPGHPFHKEVKQENNNYKRKYIGKKYGKQEA